MKLKSSDLYWAYDRYLINVWPYCKDRHKHFKISKPSFVKFGIFLNNPEFWPYPCVLTLIMYNGWWGFPFQISKEVAWDAQCCFSYYYVFSIPPSFHYQRGNRQREVNYNPKMSTLWSPFSRFTHPPACHMVQVQKLFVVFIIIVIIPFFSAAKAGRQEISG